MLQNSDAGSAVRFGGPFILLTIAVWFFASATVGCSCLIKKNLGEQVETDSAESGAFDQPVSNDPAGDASETTNTTIDQSAPDTATANSDQENNDAEIEGSDAPEDNPSEDPGPSENKETVFADEEPVAEPRNQPDETPQTPEEAAVLARKYIADANALADEDDPEQAYEKAIQAFDLAYRYAKSNKECEALSDDAKELIEEIGKELSQDTPGIDVPIKIK